MNEVSNSTLVPTGMTWPHRSAYQGISVSGTIHSVSRGWREHLSDLLLSGLSRRTFIVFDVVDTVDSEWKLDAAQPDPADLGSFGQYTSLGPFRTPYSASLSRTAFFNHPLDFKLSSLTASPVSSLPSLVFEVFDQDFFGRQFLLGFGHLPLSTISDHTIPLWLPVDAQSFADRICGVYRPLLSRSDICNKTARQQVPTLARVGSLSVSLQLSHAVGKLKPILTPLTQSVVQPPLSQSMHLLKQEPEPIVESVEAGVSTSSRSRLPTSLAPLSRIVEEGRVERRPSLPPLASLRAPVPREALVEAVVEEPVVQAGEAVEDIESPEMRSDAGFAAAVAAISMSARARRRRN